jgi:hypothetical protein
MCFEDYVFYSVNQANFEEIWKSLFPNFDNLEKKKDTVGWSTNLRHLGGWLIHVGRRSSSLCEGDFAKHVDLHSGLKVNYSSWHG